MSFLLSVITTSKKQLDNVDAEYKLTRQFTVSGQNRNMKIINESGLYPFKRGNF